MKTATLLMSTRRHLLALTAALVAGLPFAGSAANYFWNTTTTGTWATGGNWSDNLFLGGTTGTVPGASDTAFFSQAGLTAASTTVNLAADASIGGLNIRNTSTANILQSPTSHNNLILGSGGIIMNGGAAAVSLGDSGTLNWLGYVGLDGNQSWVNNSTATMSLNSDVKAANASRTLTIGGSGAVTFIIGLKNDGANLTSLVKDGSSTLSLVDNNNGPTAVRYTFTGGTTVNAGKLLVKSSAANTTTGGLTDIIGQQALTLGGGIFTATWANNNTTLANQQTLTGTTLNPGGSTVHVNHASGNATSRNAIVNLGSVTRNQGSTLNLALTGNMTTLANEYISGFAASSIINDSGVTYATAYRSSTQTESPNTYGDDWALADGSGRVLANAYAVTYTANGANSLSGNADVNATDTTLTADTSITSLRFSQAASRVIDLGGFSLTTGGILFANAVAGNYPVIQNGTLKSAATVANKDLVVIVNSGSTYPTISATIADVASGATGLAKSGAGGLILTGANTYSGPTYINGGLIRIDSDGTTPSTGYPLGYYPGSVTPGALYLNGGGLLLNPAGSDTIIGANRGITLGGNGGNFYAGTGRTLTLNGAITSATGTATPQGYDLLNFNNGSNLGTLVLAGNNSFTGGIRISGGELKLNHAGALNSTAGSENTVDMVQNNAVAASALAGAGSVLTLNGNSVAIGDLKGSGTGGAYPAVVQNANASAVTLTVGNAQNLSGSSFSGVIQDGTGGGALTLAKAGAGSLTLSPSIVRASTSGAILDVAIGVSDVSFLQLNTSVSGTGVGSSAIITNIDVVNKIIKVNKTNTAAVSGNLTFSQQLNTYSGGTTVKNGVLNAGTGVLPPSTALTLGDTVANTGGTLNISGNNNTISSIAVAGTSTQNRIQISSGVTLTDNGGNQSADYLNIAGAGKFTYSGAGKLTLGSSSVVSISDTLTVTGSGTTLELQGANTHTGMTSIEGGAALTVTHPKALGMTSSLRFYRNFTHTLNIKTASTLLNGDGTPFSRPITGSDNGGNHAINVDYANAASAFTQDLSAGTIDLGTTSVAALAVNGLNVPGTGTAVLALGDLSLPTSGVLNPPKITPTGIALTIKSITPKAPITNDYTINLKLDGTSTGNEVKGAMVNTTSNIWVNTLALTKQNSSIWTLSGVNTYGGNTTVSGGTLFVNNSHNTGTGTGNYAVNNGGTLGGNGTITLNNANFTVVAGGKLSPGSAANTAGTLTLALGTGLLDLSASAGTAGTLVFDLASPAASDLITLNSGTVSIGSGLLKLSSFNFSGTPVAGTYTLIHSANAISGTLAGTGLTGTINGLSATLQIGNGGLDVQLVLAAPAIPLTWKGNDSAIWNTTDNNWLDTATLLTPYAYQDTYPLTFDDRGSANPSITLSTTVLPGNLNFTNSTVNYSISGSGNISGTASLTKDFSGTLTLATANGYSGGTTLTAGQLNINNGGDATHSAIGTGLLTLAAGSTIDNTSGSDVTLAPNNPQIWNGSFTYAGTRNLNLGNGAVTLGASLTITNVANTLSIGGVIGGGSKNLSKAGAGTLLLTGAGGNSTFSGTLYVGSGTSGANDGAIKLTSAAPVSGISGIYVNVGGTGTSTLQLDGSGGAISISKPFSGLSGRTTTAPHIQNVAGNNVLSGQISLQSGGTVYAIQSDAGTLTLGTAGQAAITAQPVTSGTRTMNFLGNGAITVAGDIISGTGGATVAVTSSAGTLTLSGANTYGGGTIVSGGELVGLTGGSCANSAVTVAAGATNGVKVAAADGQWSCAGLTYNAGSTYADFNFNSGAPSTTVAPLQVNGNLTVNGSVQVLVQNGTFADNTDYPLLKWTGSGPANLLKFSKPQGVIGTLSLDAGNKVINLKKGIHVPNLFFTNAAGVSRMITVADLQSAGLASSQASPVYSITLPSPTSSGGGTVIINPAGTVILYEPSGSPNSDSFNYTVSDGTTTATAAVNITFVKQASSSNPQLTVLGGSVNGTLYGIPGVVYDIQRKTNLTDTAWETLSSPPLTNAPSSITADSAGRIIFSDTNPPPSSGYYRTIQH